MNNPVDQPKVSELDAGSKIKFALGLVKHLRDVEYVDRTEVYYRLEEELTRALAALPRPQATTVGVKALEWDASDVAKTELGLYIIHLREDGVWWSLHGRVTETRYENTAEAKAAAQLDFDARIRSALIGIPGAEKGEAVALKLVGFGRDAGRLVRVEVLDGAERIDLFRPSAAPTSGAEKVEAALVEKPISTEGLRGIAEGRHGVEDQSLIRQIATEALAARLAAPTSERVQALDGILEQIVLAIAFLGRDAGSDRMETTLPQIIDGLTKADAAIRALKATP